NSHLTTFPALSSSSVIPRPPLSTLFPYTTLFRSFGFDRLCAVMRGQTSIRDFIAFPKNNMGRDMMIDAPSPIDEGQLEELSLAVDRKSTRLNSSHVKTSYAVFCLKKKTLNAILHR